MTAHPRLSVPLVLETPQRVADGMGGYRIAWQALGVLHGDLRAGSGGVSPAEVGPQSVVSWRIHLRGAPDGDPRRPRAGQRLRMGQRLFVIDAVAEADPAGRYLFCIAQEERLT